MPAFDHFVAYSRAVDDIAVMRERHSAVSAVKYHGLRVDDVGRSGRGIPYVTYRRFGVGQKRELFFAENFAHEPHIFIISHLVAVVGYGYARGLLTAVL